MASWTLDDTIVAIASPADAAWRGIIRLSGVDLEPILAGVFPLQLGSEMESAARPAGRNELGGGADDRRARHGLARVMATEISLANSQRLPGRLWYWPDGRSFTGQPAAEFHTFGSPPLLQMAVERMIANGARLARPGEFTLRAFLKGRIDLVQAEAVLGVVQSQSATQFRQALVQLAGGIHGPFQQMRSHLLDLLADLEAGLDFVEDDIEFIDRASVLQILEQELAQCQFWLEQLERRHYWDGAIRVALCGSPNVGKSSLFNALVDGRRAIVSPQAGTTTDFLAGQTQQAGWRLEFVDTAGWTRPPMADSSGESLPNLAADSVTERLSANEESVDSQSQHQMARQWEVADVRLLCVDLSRRLTPLERAWLQQTGSQSETLVVGTKCDLRPEIDWDGVICRTSTFSGEGIAELVAAILANFRGRHQNDQVHLLSSTAMRCGDNLRAAEQSLSRARQLTMDREPEELAALEIRQALDELGQIIGTVYTDDLLDRIFSRFCIGK